MMSIVALVTQVLGRYCLDSLSPAFAHIWVCTALLCEESELTVLGDRD